MSIQSTINQAWSIAGVLASQSPGLQAKAEDRKALNVISKKEKINRAQIDQAKFTETEKIKGLMQEHAELAEAKYNVKPTMANKEAMDLAKDPNVDIQEIVETKRAADPAGAAAYDAQQRALQRQQRQQEKLKEEQDRARKSREFAELVTSVGGI